jgi:glucose-6-phosphate isomerase
MSALTQSKAWKDLQIHFEENRRLSMRSLFAEDPDRFERFSLKLDDLLLDYSKNLVTQKTMALLSALARQAQVEDWRERMFSGVKINFTEHRAVLHTALRAAIDPGHAPILVDGKDVLPGVRRVLEQMRSFSDSVRSVDGVPCLASVPQQGEGAFRLQYRQHRSAGEPGDARS